jgi:hypothetical protein
MAPPFTSADPIVRVGSRGRAPAALGRRVFSLLRARPLHVNLTKSAKVELFANVVAKNASFCFYFI